MLALVVGDFMGDGIWLDGWAASVPSGNGSTVDEAALLAALFFRDDPGNYRPAGKSHGLKALFEVGFRNLMKSISKSSSSILAIQLIRTLSTDREACLLRMKLSLECFGRTSKPTSRLRRVSIVCFFFFFGLGIFL